MKRFKLHAVAASLIIFTALFIPAVVSSQEAGFTFPISNWSKDQFKPPESYWAVQRQFEKSWPLFIDEQEKQFSRIYGSGIKNSYDLFLREQASTVGRNSAIQKKTLKRLLDLVSVPGKSLGGARSSQISSIRVVAFREGSLRVIPFDILEFTAAGRVVLPLGPEGNPKDGDGVLGDNDKLIFMAMDAGHKISKQYITENLKGVRDVQEIELEYAPANEYGWVYCVSFAGSPPEKSPIRYARHSSEAAIIYTPFYLVQSKPRLDKKGPAPTIEPATWAVAPSMGGIPQDIHEELALDIKLAYRIGATSENQDSFNMRFRAWFNGDVIVYGRATWKVKTPLGIGAPTIFADIMATPFYLLNQNFLCTPFDPTVLMKSFHLIIGEELNNRVLAADSAKGSRLITQDNRQGFLVDARMDPGEGDPAYKGLKRDLWHVLTGPWGSMCVFSGLNEYLSGHAAKFNLLWSDTPSNIGSYRYNLEVTDFKNRQEWMYLEWNVVPYFGSPGQYNSKNLDLVIKHHEKPLTPVVNGTTRIPVSPFILIPDIKNEKEFYRY
jgi:hypothetical protein